MPIPEVDKIWFNGELVPWHEAKVHVLTHALHYGSGVFEGIRAYKTERGPAVFRLTDHLERLRRSAKLYYMELPYTVAELAQATKELIHTNGLEHCYIRPLVFRGYGEMGLFPLEAPIDCSIAVWPKLRSSIMAAERMVAQGLTTPRPAMSGAEPWIGS